MNTLCLRLPLLKRRRPVSHPRDEQSDDVADTVKRVVQVVESESDHQRPLSFLYFCLLLHPK